MSDTMLLFSESLDDLIFARKNSLQVIRYASNFKTLHDIVEKFKNPTVLVKSPFYNLDTQKFLKDHSCNIFQYSSFLDLQKLITSEISDTSREVKDFSVLCEKSPTFSHLVGSSPAMQKLRNQIVKIASLHISVLILGETGTGKTTVARAIHELSERRNMPFKSEVLSNPNESVVEAKLFGSTKGAFTDAMETSGIFEDANGGTLFIDEIGEISPNVQTKLLQVLSEGVINRIGSNKEIKVDNRMIFATNANLELKVKKGEFREDLFYRINDVVIKIPPLRERLEDIEEIATAFLKREKCNKTISKNAIKALQTFSWKGNVRELEKCLRRAALIFCDGDTIEPEHLQF